MAMIMYSRFALFGLIAGSCSAISGIDVTGAGAAAVCSRCIYISTCTSIFSPDVLSGIRRKNTSGSTNKNAMPQM